MSAHDQGRNLLRFATPQENLRLEVYAHLKYKQGCVLDKSIEAEKEQIITALKYRQSQSQSKSPEDHPNEPEPTTIQTSQSSEDHQGRKPDEPEPTTTQDEHADADADTPKPDK